MRWLVSGFLVCSLISINVHAKGNFERDSDRGVYGWENTDDRSVQNTGLRRQIQARAAKNQHSLGYKGARIELLGRISLERDGGGYYIRDVYCNENYDGAPGRIPDDKIVNTEHTWPQSRFGGSNRDMQKSDLHHLFPSDSELNGIRGNHPFGEVARSKENLKCTCSRAGYNRDGDFVFEPPVEHRGNVARALFYFAVRYGLSIDSTQEDVLRKWHQQDPVDADELERNTEIERVQGNRNPFIDQPELVAQIDNF